MIMFFGYGVLSHIKTTKPLQLSNIINIGRSQNLPPERV